LPPSHRSITAGLTGSARNSATSWLTGRWSRNAPEPQSTFSAIVVCPKRKSSSQPVPGAARYCVVEIDAFVTVLRDLATVVAGRYDVALVARDPADNPVLACALEGGAGFVVTDDRKHLLPLKVVRLAGHAAVQIVSPGAFVRHHLPPRRR